MSEPEPTPKPAKARSAIFRVLRWSALAAPLVIGALVMDSWNAMGKRASGERLARMQASPQYAGDAFKNRMQMQEAIWPATVKWLKGGDANREPTSALDVVRRSASEFIQPPQSGLRVTWFGHSSMLIEIDGKRILTDPVWGERASPSSVLGPVRFFPPPMPLDQLPELDAIVLSHDHYDHLDVESVQALSRLSRAPFITPLGVGAHLEHWGVEAARIKELDWWDDVRLGDVKLVCTPARHFSGRGLRDRNATLWASWSFIGPQHRAFFSGDTGMFPGFSEIGQKLGPFDVTLLESGAYDAAWADVHLGPEQAVQAHRALRGKLLMPVHWGTFNLGLHGWTEPAERLVVAAQSAKVDIVVPRPGGSFEPSAPPAFKRWWPDLPWKTAEQDPVRSSGLDGLIDPFPSMPPGVASALP